MSSSMSPEDLQNLNILELKSQLTSLTENIKAMKGNALQDVDNFWLIFGGVLVFFMQAGFSLLEAGSVREKNVNNILYKNLMDAAIGALAFWFFGFGFAYGSNGNDNGFIGETNFALWKENNIPQYQGYATFFFQWAFAATAATIVSGAVAERTKIPAYFLYSFALTSFIYPVVVHWIWDEEGWLYNDMIDFAGSGVVHMVGGLSALTGAYIVGPRLGRFEPRKDGKKYPDLLKFPNHTVYDIPGHSNLLAALGVMILWVGWYGFNCASTLQISEGASFLAAKVSVTTTISAASCALTVSFLMKIKYNRWDLLNSLNGVLAGLVGITAGCAVVEPYGAFLIGIISAFVLLGASYMLKRFKIDDPLDAFPVHGACGIWGVLAAGFFATEDNVQFAYARAKEDKSGGQIANQFLGVVCIFVWTVVTSALLFTLIKHTIGMRVEEKDESQGLDEAEHGGAAYHHDVELASVSEA